MKSLTKGGSKGSLGNTVTDILIVADMHFKE